MGVFDGLGADIAEILNDLEMTKEVRFTLAGDGAEHDLDGGGTEPTPTYEDVQAVVASCTRELRSGLGVAAGDLKVEIMAAEFETITPTEDGTITIDSKAYRIAAMITVFAGPDPIQYAFQARR